MVLAFRGAGELIGDLAMIDDRPHSSTVVAVEPVEALLVSSRDFRTFLEQRPGAGIALIRMVVDRFRDTDRKLVEFSTSDALGRVASRLLELATAHGEQSDRGISIALHLSQEELAGWSGCSVKAVVNSLQTLRRLGLIETGRRSVANLSLLTSRVSRPAGPWADRHRSQEGVDSCGAPTGLLSGEPRWRR